MIADRDALTSSYVIPAAIPIVGLPIRCNEP